VHNHVVPDLQVVSERELYEVECLEVTPHPLEDVWGQDAAESNPQMDVAGERGTVELLPQPDEGLPLLEAFHIDFGIVLGLQGDIARIHLGERDPGSERKSRGINPGKPRVVDFGQGAAAKLPTVVPALQRGSQLGEPFVV
jgi:hypothetical protein